MKFLDIKWDFCFYLKVSPFPPPLSLCPSLSLSLSLPPPSLPPPLHVCAHILEARSQCWYFSQYLSTLPFETGSY